MVRISGQIGFIEYLVAPFLVTVTKVLPPAEPMLTQMMLNVKSWRDKWEAAPPRSLKNGWFLEAK